MTTDIRRVDVKVGYSCNNNCMHCVIGDRRGTFADRSTQAVKDILCETREKFNDVVLTGGEFTIRKDSLEIVKHASDLGFIVNLQSNARAFSSKKYCEEYIHALGTAKGAFTLALLSSTEDLHNALTRANSYLQVIKGLSNLIELGQNVNTNTVITKINYRTLPETAKLLVHMGINSYQFAFVHCCGNAFKYIDRILPRKSDVAPYVKRALQVGIDRGISSAVEAFPMCFLGGGYEACVSERHTPSKIKLVDQPEVIDDFLTRRINIEKKKGPNCHLCLYDRFCEGPWYQYPDYYGWDEFVPFK